MRPQTGFEPVLTFKISNVNEFRCSACDAMIASIDNGRFVVSGLADLIDAFKDHVARFHSKELHPSQMTEQQIQDLQEKLDGVLARLKTTKDPDLHRTLLAEMRILMAQLDRFVFDPARLQGDNH